MVQIVSGVSDAPEFDSGAVLRGFEKGAAYRQRQQAAEQDQISQALRMKEIQMRFQDARTKQEELLAHKAAMGDAHAVQEMVLRSQLPESDKMAQDLLKAAANTHDEEAHAMLMASGKVLVDETRKKEKRAAFQTAIERAAQDGLLDPNPQPTDPATAKPGAMPTVGDYMARADAGEPIAGMSKEIAKARAKRSTLQANMDDNAKYIEQMTNAIAAMPPGRQRRLATIALNEYRSSPSKQQDEGSGAEVFKEIQKLGVGSLSQYDELRKAEQEYANQKPAPGMPGMTVGERNEAISGGENILGQLVGALAGQQKLPRNVRGKMVPKTAKRRLDPLTVRQAIDASPTPDHFLLQLEQAGVDPNSDEGAQMILDSLKGGNAPEPSD